MILNIIKSRPFKKFKVWPAQISFNCITFIWVNVFDRNALEIRSFSPRNGRQNERLESGPKPV